MNRPDFYYTRKLLSWLFFIAGVVCLILYFVQGMENFMLLISSIILFVWAYLVSPHHYKKLADQSDLLLDECIIELVFAIILFPIRIIGKGLHYLLD